MLSLRKNSPAYEAVPSSVEIPEANVSVPENSSLIGVKIMQLGKDTVNVRVDPDWTVEDFKAKVFNEDYNKGKNIRVIYFGKLLNDRDTLANCGVKDNSFLHVAVSERLVGSQSAAISNPEDLHDGVAEEKHVYNPEDFEVAPVGEGSNGDFAVGFAMGFVIGMIMLIWIWQPRIPRKQKVGILAGICFNLFMSYMDRDKSSTSTGGVQDEPSTTAGTGN